ncbi:MAG TPA: serine/threonine-protein kinase [Polyangia bacterium]|nr:serine/threonine-protein kinase [Polyangia bacterium]
MAQHGRYKIIKRVADGGMAEIFLATQLGREGFAKPVILKRIHSTIYADPQFRNMFIDEAHISMSLSHSNIVQVLDLGVSAGRYFLVLELVDGWDLGRVLHRAATAGVRLPRELALHVTADVCRALAYAHAKAEGDTPLGIVHRDVSPHNILLSEQGEVKLTDFGIAKAMNKREHTGTGVVKGKVAFMSPEQAMGKPIDQRSDLFALGTVLYLLVTRARPFEGPSDLETLLRVQKGDFRAPEEAAPDLPPEVAAVVSRAMRKEPEERYQSADEMLADVERVLRTAFRPVGQTELKRWLAELGAKDGVPPISQSTERATSTRARTGTGELEEEDVVLLDTTDEEVVNGEEATSLAVVNKGGGGSVSRPRMTRARPTTPDLPVPQDAESMADISGRQELALPIPEEEGGRPGRRRARRGSGLSILFIGALLVAGAWFGGKYARTIWASITGAAATTATQPAPSDQAHAQPAPGPAPEAPAKAPAADEAAPPRKAEAEAPTRREPAAAHEAAHEPARRRAGGERPRDFVGRDLSQLKMAPDPSLLPAPAPPAPAPKAAEPPPASPPAPENP